MAARWLSKLAVVCFVLFNSFVKSVDNEDSAGLFTLVGCDDVDLDTIIEGAYALAQAATDEIQALQSLVAKDEASFYNIRNAMLFFGVQMEEADGGGFQLTDDAKATMAEVGTYYYELIQALEGNGVWTPETTWMFCKPYEGTPPLVAAVNFGDYWNNLPEEVAEQPMSDQGTSAVYYEPAGFNSQGARAVSWVGTATNPPNADICSNVAANVVAFTYKETGEVKTWMALCSQFYDLAVTVDSAVSEDATNLDAYSSQAGTMLHELLHLLSSDIIDVQRSLGGGAPVQKFYETAPCCDLASPLAGTQYAVQNGDNYRLYALSAYLEKREWDPDPVAGSTKRRS